MSAENFIQKKYNTKRISSNEKSVTKVLPRHVCINLQAECDTPL